MDTVENWSELTPKQKQEERFKKWLSPPDVDFITPEAEKAYKQRVTRFIKAIKLEEPDRVPVMLPVGNFPAYYAGYDLKTVMNDYDAMKESWLKFMYDFGDMDTFGGPGLILPAKALEIIDHKIHIWPGHGLPDDIPSYQFVEKEYIKANEYEKLIQDPTDFWMRSFMSRIAGALKPLAQMPQLTAFVGIPIFYLASFGNPEIQSAYKAMMKAGEEVMRWQQVLGEISMIAISAGYPPFSGGFSGAPFDMLSDMCRGTTGTMLDMYRQPEKIHEAMEKLVPITVKEAVANADASISPIVMMPLHKGDRTFMSDDHFNTFYWPTFRKVLLGMIEEGLVPMPFAEGNYIPRLKFIKDTPRASMIWYFEHMDMTKAKTELGDTSCITGNLPVSVMTTGTPQEVKNGCRKLIETCAPGGGYILSAAASVDKGNMENLRAMMDAAKEYGTYE